ncbi:CobW family GTP-binding protein [Bacillus songklensis]|uniref:CobW family GTP-binding protein n=1 Tax=Bacillus songklensis TaxID=1069116 RepID=A0ABV8B754_9BACI
MKKVEIYILGGFLGSGKTTLLQNLLKEEKKTNQKVAVLLNEIGEHSVDTDIIGKEMPLKELLNGCICCTMKDELEIQLLSLYQEHQPDVIYIETTGVAHPIEVLDACLSPVIAPYIEIKSIVSVIDSKRWLDRDKLSLRIKKLLEEQVRHGDHILINKVDLITREEREDIQKEIMEINPRAKVHLTDYSNISIEELSQPSRSSIDSHEEMHVHNHLHIQTMTYQFQDPVIKEEFDDWLKSIPESIYRIKGFLQFRDDEVYTHLFQYSYRLPFFFPQSIKFPKNLVFIGENLNKEMIKEELMQLEQNAKRKVTL